MKQGLLLLGVGLLCLIVSVQSQTVIMFNGTVLPEPRLLFHDEISVGTTPTSGVLTCTVGTVWRRVNTGMISSTTSLYQSTSTSSGVRLYRTGDPIPNTDEYNGLFSCVTPGFEFVGIYNRGNGRGAITQNTVTLPSSSFVVTPTFTLQGDTSGGPPVEYTWTRNGVVITNDGSHTITIMINNFAPGSTFQRFANAVYRSTLMVTGVLPGVYRYSVNNRATPTSVNTDFNIEGAAPTNLMLNQISVTMITASWTPPPAPPSTGYQITVDSDDFNTGMDTMSSTQDISVQLGMRTIRVRSRSIHFPSEVIITKNIIVLDNLPPVNVMSSLLTATSVTISWSPATNSLPAESYTVSLTRMTGDDNGMCVLPSDVRSMMNIPSSTTSMEFTNLTEFSNYTFTVSTVALGDTSEPSSTEFTTPSVAPTAPPPNVMSTITTSRSITVTWDPIICMERNGIITSYTVEFEPSENPTMRTGITGLTFTPTEQIIPFTNYTFRVAGVNSVDTGVYSNIININTPEDAPGPVLNLASSTKFTSIVLTWDPPQEPNGVILSYEVIYRISGDSLEMVDAKLNTTFTIAPLNTGTEVSDVSVTAYTSVGRGVQSNLTNLVTLSEPPMVMNVMVVIETSTSARVSWDVIAFPGITGYTVFLSPTGNRKRQAERAVDVPDSSTNSVLIEDLMNGVEYQFTVVAVANLNGAEITGPRTMPTIMKILLTTIPPPVSSPSVGPIIAGVIIAIVLAVVVVVAIVLFLLLRRSRQANSKRRTDLDSVRYARSGAPDLVDIKQHNEPLIEDFPSDTNAMEGESVIFKILVSGKPEPTITWFHNGDEISTNYAQDIQPDGSLSFPSTETKLSGVYKMVAANIAGSAAQEVKLNVTFEAEKTPDMDKKSMTIAAIPVENFGVYVEENNSNDHRGFRDQFMALESGDSFSKSVGLSTEFKKHNRFANITVYDHNRICLQPLPGYVDNGDFVNGCYIEGYSKPKKFIATQGPIPKTLVDFWRLVWQEKAPTIVMVTNVKEGNKKKCEQYWPDNGSATYGPFKVTITEQQVLADYCIRTMLVTLEGNNRPVKVEQFHFTAWPDHGVPDYATPILAFHRRVMSAHKTRRGPILIHCSAGVGRTGTFVCIDNVLDQIKKEEVVDIAGVINKMRHQRMKMVQTPEQYIFLHSAILESVTCGDTQINAGDLRMVMRKYEKVDLVKRINKFQEQYNVLEQVSPKVSEVVSTSASKNIELNRSTKYLPSERYRVILKGEHPDYIHAVFAHGYKHQKAYIIAEGPMATTVRNMCKILYERKCGAIVMLSKLVENGSESSVQYWPAIGQLAQFGEYTVDLINEEALEGFTIRTLSILEQKSQKAHQVTQFHITCWGPDGRCSNIKSVVDAIDEMSKVQRKTGNKPIFVHCSDTVTRSGMFCAMATIIDRCKTEGAVDVFQVIKALRVQKPGSVPTVEDYQTVFNAILTFLDSFDTYANFQNV